VIAVSTAKAHLRIDHPHEDDLISDMIEGARGYIERRIGWRLDEPAEVVELLCGDGSRVLWLRQPPIDGVVEIAGLDEEEYKVRGSMLLREDEVWEYGRDYEITYTAGFELDQGPPDLMQAIKLLVGGWHENREAWVTGTIVSEHRHSVSQIIGLYERVRA
jgi:hypothetical protein